MDCHAYGDLVSTFEMFCKRKAAKLPNETCNSQELFDARKFLKRHAGVDMLGELSPRDLLALRRVFNKRYVCVHNGGLIAERYVRMVPEDAELIDEKARLELAELGEAALAMRSALAILVRSIEQPG